MTKNILDARDMVQTQARMTDGVADNLILALSETAGVRSIAANRLARRDQRVAELILFCSVYLIVLMVLPYVLSISAEVTGYLDFFRIVLSIVILMAAIFQYSSNNYAKAEQLRRSSLELSELKREVEMRRDKIDFDELDMARIRFDNILEKYAVAHDGIDYLKYQIDNREKYPSIGRISAFITGIEISLRESTPRIDLIIISAVMLFLLAYLFSSYPARLPG